jgi:hypothetical protein
MSLLVKLVFALCTCAGWHHGIAAHYSPGLFDRVAAYRGLPAADCYISSDWHAIGDYVLVYGVNTEQTLVCLVADVSQPRDRKRHMRQGLFEVDFHAARVLCGRTDLPNRQCPIRVSK